MEARAEKHPHIPARRIIDRLVLGGSDGAIEGVAMTAALDGAGIHFSTILLAGLAFATAGGVSMFFSSYLSSRSELNSLKIDVEREKMEIDTEPEEERAELEALLKKEGYGQQEVDVIMGRVMKDKDLWLREQLSRELKLHIEDLTSGSLTWPASAGLAFFLMAMLAVSPYSVVAGEYQALFISLGLSLAALFVLGSRAFLPRNFNAKEGLESAVVGCVAAAALFAVGTLFASL